jgi:hypothetical protein
VDEEDNDTTPSLYEHIKNDIAFKIKVIKKERQLKAEMTRRKQERQKRLDKLKNISVATK